MSLLSYIIWSTDPVIFTIPLSSLGWQDRPIVWYGLLFALGFIISQQVMYRIFRTEGKDERDVDVLTTHMVIATIVGARLGHCLFYNPGYYLSNPIEILKIWEGGLASHGGAIGIILALWIYANLEITAKWFAVIPIKFSIKRKKREGQSFLWILDRVAIVVVLTGAMIRTGNLMNSEMEGVATNSETGIVYARGTSEALNYGDKVESVSFEKGGDLQSDVPGKVPVTAIIKYRRGVEVDQNEIQFIERRLKPRLFSYREVSEHIDFGDPDDPLLLDIEKRGGVSYLKIYAIGTVRHAAQMYEAAYCILIMIVLFWIWKNRRDRVPIGFNFALLNIMLWSLRFFDEFLKMDQEAFEEDIPLNMGQWLSIPMFLMGVTMMIVIYNKKGAK